MLSCVFVLMNFIYFSQSRRVYNEFYGNIELDSVYADLLNDYLNYFLPVTERDVNFPTFSTTNSSSSSNNSSGHQHQATLKPSSSHVLTSRHHQHKSLFKRVIQKSASASADELSMLTGGGGGESDRSGEMKKIDLFLNMINELLMLPFTDIFTPIQTLKYSPFNNDLKAKQISSQTYLNLNATNRGPNAFQRGVSSSSTSTSSSPVKYDDLKHNVSNLEIVFALSLILKHSHFFSNAFQSNNADATTVHFLSDMDKKCDGFLSNSKRPNNKYISDSPIDELRT
jgi:hypothetical protein